MAERHADRDALVACHQDVRLTYGEVDAAVDSVSRALMALGLGRGDRLGIWAPNRAEWALTQFATARIGVVLVNINPAYRTSELRYALASPAAAFSSPPPGSRAPTTSRWSTRSAASSTASSGGLARRRGVAGAVSAAGGVSADALESVRNRSRRTIPINIQYTWGTTGFPKGATLTHHNILNNGYFVGEALRLTEDDRICIPVPFYHCFGMVMGNLRAVTHGAAGRSRRSPSSPRRRWRPSQEERCTSLYGVPTMFIAELEHPDFAASTCRRCAPGSWPARPARSR